MIIGCTGFSWSGSSAVTDLLMEYSENQVYRKEFIFAYHPDSLSDLDFHLNDECSKFLSSSVAIPRFRKIAKKLLNAETNGKIKKITDDYLDNIIQTSWIGDCNGQILLHNSFIYDYLGQRIMSRRVIPKLPYNFTRKLRIYPLKTMNFSIRPDNFLNLTQQYTNNILESMGFDISKNIVLDQPFPGNAPSRTMRYFKDSRAIIVDRDPRDLYLIVKHFFKKENLSVPIDSVEKFIIYYKQLHVGLEEEKRNPNVLYINFESLVYNYNDTVKSIENFLCLKEHTFPGKYFSPAMSFSNTKLFKKVKCFEEDIKIIEAELKDYLFDFDSFDVCFNNAKCFDTNPLINERKYKHGKK